MELHAAHVSPWFMIAGFVLVFILTLVVFNIRSANLVPYRPHSIAAPASVLRASRDLQTQLVKMGHLRTRMIRQRLAGYSYSTTLKPSSRRQSIFSIEIQVSGSETKFRHPLAIRRPVVALILVLLPMIISALETLQHLSYSYKHDGFVAIPPRGSVVIAAEEFMSHVPTLVMLPVASLVNYHIHTVRSVTAGTTKRWMKH